MRSRRGQSMVEFAIIAPILFVLLIGLIDLMRMNQSNSTVAEAARQGARQAVANAYVGDNAFGAPDANPCEGTAFTTGASGQGCLTDGRIRDTVASVMGPLTQSVTLVPATTAAHCPAPSNGNANVCVAPSQTSPAATGFNTCAAAKASLGHDPLVNDLGGRQAEWGNPLFKGCYLVQVTVVYAYSPLIGFIKPFVSSLFKITSSTSMVAEY